ncbi:NADH-quinone oxidoreductase subunit A [bacterium]|nr:NADH-quinone oxidoreductase subunit A [bacterium]MBU1881500.1 NADH-quinone oxidoreductase subunit A [bacterium]
MLISAGILTAIMMAVAIFLGPKKMTKVKAEPFECGIEPTGDANDTRFPVKFYLVAILFILFDIEIVFLYPWAVVFNELPMAAFVSIVIFMTVLMAGLLYAIKKGVLEWK